MLYGSDIGIGTDSTYEVAGDILNDWPAPESKVAKPPRGHEQED
jgi:hypothetical protein